jgi:hypothetical protein
VSSWNFQSSNGTYAEAEVLHIGIGLSCTSSSELRQEGVLNVFSHLSTVLVPGAGSYVFLWSREDPCKESILE